MAKIYVNTIGLVVILDCKEDISAATTVIIKVEKPNGVTVEWTSAIYNTNFVKYTTESGDLPLPGDYKLQAHFTLGDWTGPGDTAILVIDDKFK